MTEKFFAFRALTLLALLSCLFVAACQSVPPVTPADQIPQTDALLRLSPGDTLAITVYGEDTMTGSYMLDEDGNINLPLIGGITAGGLTKKGLQDEISARLVDGGFQLKPYVTVGIESMRPFYINGEVGTPGSYPYQPTLDLFQAVAVAGGYSPRADQGKVMITRMRDGQRIRFFATQETPVWPGDSIMVYQRLF